MKKFKFPYKKVPVYPTLLGVHLNYFFRVPDGPGDFVGVTYQLDESGVTMHVAFPSTFPDSQGNRKMMAVGSFGTN